MHPAPRIGPRQDRRPSHPGQPQQKSLNRLGKNVLICHRHHPPCPPGKIQPTVGHPTHLAHGQPAVLPLRAARLAPGIAGKQIGRSDPDLARLTRGRANFDPQIGPPDRVLRIIRPGQSDKTRLRRAVKFVQHRCRGQRPQGSAQTRIQLRSPDQNHPQRRQFRTRRLNQQPQLRRRGVKNLHPALGQRPPHPVRSHPPQRKQIRPQMQRLNRAIQGKGLLQPAQNRHPHPRSDAELPRIHREARDPGRHATPDMTRLAGRPRGQGFKFSNPRPQGPRPANPKRLPPQCQRRDQGRHIAHNNAGLWRHLKLRLQCGHKYSPPEAPVSARHCAQWSDAKWSGAKWPGAQ